MFLLILESLGTWELLLVGMVALVIFGPRRIPELARKAGKIMAEFRKVSNEFRSTWEREAMLTDDEKDAFNFNKDIIAREEDISEEHPSLKDANIGADTADEEAQTTEGKEVGEPVASSLPEIKEVTDTEQIEKLRKSAASQADESQEKENWF